MTDFKTWNFPEKLLIFDSIRTSQIYFIIIKIWIIFHSFDYSVLVWKCVEMLLFFLQPVVVYSQVKVELSQAPTTQSLTAIWIAAPGCWKPLKAKPSLWVTSQLRAQQTVWEVPSEFWGTDLRQFGKSEMWNNEISSHWFYLKEGMKITQQNYLKIVLSEKQKDPSITWLKT